MRGAIRWQSDGNQDCVLEGALGGLHAMREAIRWSDGNQDCHTAKGALGRLSVRGVEQVVPRRAHQWPSDEQSGLISGHTVQSGLIRVHQMSNQGSSVAIWCNQGSSVASTWLAAWNEALKSLRVLANRSDLSFSLNFSCRMRIEPTFLTMPLRAPQ